MEESRLLGISERTRYQNDEEHDSAYDVLVTQASGVFYSYHVNDAYDYAH